MTALGTTPLIIISLALVFYSIGVWSERIQGKLKPWHLVFFYLGLVCDTWGTGLMIESSGWINDGCSRCDRGDCHLADDDPRTVGDRGTGKKGRKGNQEFP